MVAEQGYRPSVNDLEELLVPTGEVDWALVSILSALLDAHLLLEEPSLPADELTALFQTWWPDDSLSAALARLVAEGLITRGTGNVVAVPPHMHESLAAALHAHFLEQRIDLPSGSLSLAQLLDGLREYCQAQMIEPLSGGSMPPAWGGTALMSAERRHLLLFRPFPLRLQAHPEAYTLLICQFPEDGAEAVTGPFVRDVALRQRVALYDLERGEKMNLTRSDVFIHFERFLRWVHRLRIAPSPALTRGLMDAGLLVVEKS